MGTTRKGLQYRGGARRGMTIVETLVVCGLLGILTTGFVVVFANFARWSHVSQVRRDDVDQAQRGMARLQLEMTNSGSAYVSLANGMVFFPVSNSNVARPLSFDSTGKLLYQTWVVYAYDTTTHELWRGEAALAATSAPGAPPTISSFYSTRHRIAFPVIGFTVTPGSAQGLYAVAITVGRADMSTQLTSQVGTRN